MSRNRHMTISMKGKKLQESSPSNYTFTQVQNDMDKSPIHEGPNKKFVFQNEASPINE